MFLSFLALIQSILAKLNMNKNSKISNQDRERIVNSYINGNSILSISEVIDVKRTTANAIIKKYQTTGKVHADQRGGSRKQALSDEQKNIVKSLIDGNCTLSLKDLTLELQNEYGITVSKSTVNRVIAGLITQV